MLEKTEILLILSLDSSHLLILQTAMLEAALLDPTNLEALGNGSFPK